MAQDKSESRFTVINGLQYSRASEQLKMDLFIPEDGGDAIPCIMVIQGGGYRTQDGQRFRPFAEFFAKHGFVAALIAYRGIPEYQYRTTIGDAKTAVRFLRKISDEYPIDPERIGAMGGSAGGTLAAFLAVTGDMEGFETEGEYEAYSSRLACAASYAGISDFIARFTDPQHIDLQPEVRSKKAQIEQWIGVPFTEDSKHWIQASAINHVDKSDPPVLFLHCRQDSTSPWLQSQEMHDKMKEAGIASEVTIYKNGSHMYHFQSFETVLHPGCFVFSIRPCSIHESAGFSGCCPADILECPPYTHP